MNFQPHHLPPYPAAPYPASIHVTFVEPDDTTLTYDSATGGMRIRLTDAQALALAEAILKNVKQLEGVKSDV